ncbi:Glutamine-binding periplasmic protein [Leucobacter aridicollis]|uniref:transporter substrate-binding domain-containing protein n=1 Tax=Leucobacter aridicollis TaxID=283878 RepID=UPI000EB082C8|nr:transporter substrate-binding domain-containing protein [Leucobacter aridicollis]MCS3426669.1 polar amino acid transport system substrate-binding protein [Leucobacter aridicollis]RKQ89185.1 polar amino acid transport system substrate-binding protein [Mycolicibacterium mucogenicum 261Sha1.1M5]
MKKQLVGIAAVAAILITAGCSAPGDDAGKGGNEEPTPANTAVDLSALGVDEAAKELVPAEIAERGTVVVGVDATYPPNEFKDEAGNAIGWEVDMVAAAITRLGLEPELKIAKFENIIPNIELGKFDLGIAGYYDTLKRQQDFDVVDFIWAGNQFASLEKNAIDDELDICGEKIAVPNGGSAPLYYLPEVQKKCDAAGKGTIDTLGYDTTDEMVAAVNLGRAFALVADSPVVSYAVKNSEGKLVGSPIYENMPAGAPFSKKTDGKLAEAFAAALQSMHDDGTYDEILKFWGVEAGRYDKITINAGDKD